MRADRENADFDKAPPVKVGEYDSSIKLFCGAYEEIFKLAHSCLRSILPRNARILVTGAGTGAEILEMAPGNPGWSFVGVDPSIDMLSIAREKIAGERLPNDISFVRTRVEDLDAAGEFDGATCILVMHFLEDDGSKLDLLDSIARRLKPGAPLVLVDGCGDPGSKAFTDTVEAWKKYPEIKGVAPETVRKAFADVIMKKIRFVPESRIIDLLEEAGFAGTYRFYSAFLYSGWTALRKGAP